MVFRVLPHRWFSPRRGLCPSMLRTAFRPCPAEHVTALRPRDGPVHPPVASSSGDRPFLRPFRSAAPLARPQSSNVYAKTTCSGFDVSCGQLLCLWIARPVRLLSSSGFPPSPCQNGPRICCATTKKKKGKKLEES